MVKVKVKLSLYLTKHHFMKTYWGVEVQFHAFFISVRDLEVSGYAYNFDPDTDFCFYRYPACPSHSEASESVKALLA
jgi:hypothetical protein